MQIKQANRADAEQCYAILNQCREALALKSIFQWTPHYPTLQSILTDIKQNEGFVFTEKKEILAYMQICGRQDLEYKAIPWKLQTEKVLTVHRLAIRPEFQGQGIAHKMMNFAEQFATEHSFEAIRLDAYSKNLIALNFYQNKGYYICGETYFPHREYPFYCFEKPL